MKQGKSINQISASSRYNNIIKWFLILLVIFIITGFFILPPVLKAVLTNKLSEKLDRIVTIQEIKVNPFMLSVDVKGFEIKERKSTETFISFDELYLNLQTVSVFKRGVILSELRIDKPYIKIVRNEDLTYSFSDLLKSDKKGPSQKSEPLKYSLNNIRINNGRVDFSDLPKHTGHSVSSINASIPLISNLPYYTDSYVTPSFEAKLNGRLFELKGQTKPFADTLETTFNVNIKDLDIPYYLEYVPLKMDYKILSAYLDVNSTISYSQIKDRSPRVSFKGTILLKNIEVADTKNDPLVKLPAFDITVADSDLLISRIHFSKILLNAPELNVVRDASGRINLHALVPVQDTSDKTENASDKARPVIEADEIGITHGTVYFSDFSNNKNFKTTLEKIEFKVNQFSSVRDSKSGVSMSLQTESQETAALAGSFTLDPLSSAGTFELKQLPVKKYSPYYREHILFDIEDAVLDLSTTYGFKKTEDTPEIILSGMTATLNSLRLRQRGDDKDFLLVPEISIKDTDIDLAKREITIGALSTNKGGLNISRQSDGVLNVQNLIPSSQTDVKPAGTDQEHGGKPFLIAVKSLLAERYTMNYEDLVPSDPVKLTAGQIRIKGENLSSGKNTKSRIALSFKLNRSGSVSAGGTLVIDPLSANLALNIRDIEITPFQPYFTDRINIIVTGGGIMTKGNLSVSSAGEGGFKAAFKGEAALTNLATVDKLNSDDFLKWQSLYFSGIDAGYNPLHVNIGEIALTDFYSRLIVNQDGTLNMQGIVRDSQPVQEETSTAQTAEEKPDAVKEKSSAPVKIEKLTLQGGTINFTDNHIKPNYSVNMLEIGGRVSGLSSEEDTTADVDLRGKLENYAPLEITGRINPLGKDLFVDLKADFKDMDLSPLTPYSGKYIGYTIEKGKLSLGLKYLIVKKKLDSQNSVFLDQFTFGDTVESPDATKLPVKLAIALLKDREGKINLDLPVTGEIDDPKFSIWRIVIKILLNLLVKAATSPFALLGAIFGGGEELAYVEFDYGSHDISSEGAIKLDTLIKVLHDRPSLKLEMQGFVDPEKDRDGLIQRLFQKKVKSQKLKDMVKKGQPAVPVDEIIVQPDEYPLYLKMAYKEEKFPKPRNIIGMAKDLPVPEMEKLLLTHIEIKDEDLRQLASQRSLNVKDYMLKSQQVEQEKIFLIETKSLKPDLKEKVKDSRVDFKLK